MPPSGTMLMMYDSAARQALHGKDGIEWLLST